MKGSKKRLLWYVLGGILLSFAALTILVSVFPVSVIDRKFSEEVQEHQYPILDLLMEAVSWPGSAPQSLMMVAVTSLLFFLYKYKKESLFILLTLASGIISTVLKIVIDRPRPTEDLVRVIHKAQYQSFPSGHVLFYIIFFGFLIIIVNHLKEINRALRMSIISLCALMIMTVPISRVYLGAHWFTDVLGSAMLGVVCLFGLSSCYLKNNAKLPTEIHSSLI